MSTTTVAAGGTPQSTTVNTSFAFPLVARVMDASRSPVPGVTVTFTAPAPLIGTLPQCQHHRHGDHHASGLATAPALTATDDRRHVRRDGQRPRDDQRQLLTDQRGWSASRLAFTQQPSASTVAGTAFARQPVVTVQDAFGNTVTTDTSAVTLIITGRTGHDLRHQPAERRGRRRHLRGRP